MNDNNILTFSTEKTKEEIVALAHYHRDADVLIRGDYGSFCNINEHNKGCSIGCMFPNKHSDGYKVAGVCPQLLYLVDRYFEKQLQQDAVNWHVWFWENMPVGVNSWDIFSEFMSQMLINPTCGAFGKNMKSDKHLKIVSDLYKNSGTKQQFKIAAAAANATAYAANAAVYAAIAYAANAAAIAYAADADAAADAAAADAAAAAAADAAAAAAATAYAAYQNQINLLKQVILSFNQDKI